MVLPELVLQVVQIAYLIPLPGADVFYGPPARPRSLVIVHYMNIGDKITALRKAKDMSQTDLGKAVGVSREIIGRYERNEVLPSVEVAKKNCG